MFWQRKHGKKERRFGGWLLSEKIQKKFRNFPHEIDQWECYDTTTYIKKDGRDFYKHLNVSGVEQLVVDVIDC